MNLLTAVAIGVPWAAGILTAATRRHARAIASRGVGVIGGERASAARRTGAGVVE